jgi:hypothetical protein
MRIRLWLIVSQEQVKVQTLMLESIVTELVCKFINNISKRRMFLRSPKVARNSKRKGKRRYYKRT